MKKIIIGLIVVIALGVVLFFVFKNKDGKQKFVTDKITRGDIKSTVSATGTVNAVTTVQVGTQVSGTIQKLFVDFNSPVKKGQLLAQIDPAIFDAQVGQARANLLSAKANLEKSQVMLRDTKTTLERNKILYAKNFIAKSDLDTSETNYLSAIAQIKVAEAQIQQTQAALDSSSINLKYSKILSPVNGTVISRNIDIGQTVAASFQTPTLFTIAQDLTKMQIDTSVDESDIGTVKASQKAAFTVDAYPESTFNGEVSVVRNAPINVSNVVTYNAVIIVDNTGLKLKPGMTATARIVTAQSLKVLRVPSQALRFTPAAAAKLGLAKTVKSGQQVIWVERAGKLVSIPVTVGLVDDTFAEIKAGDLKLGDQVVTSEATADAPKVSSTPSLKL